MSIRAGRRSRIITTEPYNRMNKTNNRNNNNNANNNSNTTKVYVGNLPWDLTWQDLKDHMKTIGTVQNVDILTDRNGRSKGSAIVEYSRANDALQAIQQLHDSVLKGRPIQVREDRDAVRQDNRGNTNDKGDGNGGMTITIANDTNASTTTNTNTNNRNKNSNNKTVNTETVIGRHVYVGNLSWDVAWQDLKDHMKAAGNVLRADVMTESNGRSKGCGIVEYSTVEEAREAIATLNDTTLMNRLIFVREDRERANTTASSRRLYVGNLVSNKIMHYF